MATAVDWIPLSLLQSGESAKVAYVAGSVAEQTRLQELGFQAGAAVEMIRRGCPCIVRLGGAKLCFRDTDGCRILVERV